MREGAAFLDPRLQLQEGNDSYFKSQVHTVSMQCGPGKTAERQRGIVSTNETAHSSMARGIPTPEHSPVPSQHRDGKKQKTHQR